MKKLFLFATIALFLFTACEPQDNTPKNPLVGTLWTYNNVDYIEFLDESNVKMFGGTGEDNGTYSIEGNIVYFNDLCAAENFTATIYYSAEFTSNTLKVKYNHYGGSDYYYYATFVRK